MIIINAATRVSNIAALDLIAKSIELLEDGGRSYHCCVDLVIF